MTAIVEYKAEPDRSGNVRLSRVVEYGTSDINRHTVSSVHIHISASDALDIVAAYRIWIDGRPNDLRVWSVDPEGDSILRLDICNGVIRDSDCAFLSWAGVKVFKDDLSSDWMGRFIKEIETAAYKAISRNRYRRE